MSATTFKLETPHWPYGITVEVVKGGLLLRPSRKARAGWAKAFTRSRSNPHDDTAEFQGVVNKFDDEGWKW